MYDLNPKTEYWKGRALRAENILKKIQQNLRMISPLFVNELLKIFDTPEDPKPEPLNREKIYSFIRECSISPLVFTLISLKENDTNTGQWELGSMSVDQIADRIIEFDIPDSKNLILYAYEKDKSLPTRRMVLRYPFASENKNA